MEKNHVKPVKMKVIEYWESQKSIYPTLYKFVLKLNLIQPTSSSSERVFSNSSRILDESRLKLLPSKVQSLAIMHGNKDIAKKATNKYVKKYLKRVNNSK